MNKKLIEIDIVILVILFTISGFGSWYFVKTQTEAINKSAEGNKEELNDKIRELEKLAFADKSCESPTKDLKPGEVTELFLNMYMFGSGVGYNGIINTSKYDNYVTENFKITVRDNLAKMKDGPGADPILFVQDNPDNGFKVEKEDMNKDSATVVVFFDYSGTKGHRVEFSLVFENELWKLDSNEALN